MQIVILFVLASIYFLLFAAPAIVDSSNAFIGGLSGIIPIFFFLCTVSINRWLWAACWSALCISSILLQHFVSTYGVEVNAATASVFFEATPREINSFITLDMIAAILCALVLSMIGIRLFNRQKTFFRTWKHQLFFSIVALLLCVMTARHVALPKESLPYHFLEASYVYWKDRLASENEWKYRKNIGEQAGTVELHGKNPLVIVLVIGESARADHFSLNGYTRETNPLLKTQTHLLNFPNTTSCGVSTSVSVPCMLTRATPRNLNLIYQETSLISVFNALGFETVWLGAQGVFSQNDPVTVISREASRRTYLANVDTDNPVYDEHLLPLFDRVINSGGNKLVILHTSGSHWPYGLHYPALFERYAPACKRQPERAMDIIHYKQGIYSPRQAWMQDVRKCEDAGNLINAYDNTILYTDRFLHTVIERLKNRNALFLYSSDHGESLGENGRYLHLHQDAPAEWHVPMFFWGSDEFIAVNPVRWQALEGNIMKNVSHDHIFHSVLDCAGVNSVLVDKSLSLCRPAYKQ